MLDNYLEKIEKKWPKRNSHKIYNENISKFQKVFNNMTHVIHEQSIIDFVKEAKEEIWEIEFLVSELYSKTKRWCDTVLEYNDKLKIHERIIYQSFLEKDDGYMKNRYKDRKVAIERRLELDSKIES